MFGGYFLEEKTGNNTFCFDSKSPLWITPMKFGKISDAKVGEKTVFREFTQNIDDSLKLENNLKHKNFVGLENLILQKRKLPTGKSQFIFLVDNHNYALWCWSYAISQGIIGKENQLTHIDQHSDMNENFDFKPNLDSFSEKNIIYKTNIANFIKPAIAGGIVSDVDIILTEYQFLNKFSDSKKCGFDVFYSNGILDIDLDFRDKKMSHTNLENHKKIITNLIQSYPVVTVATSPCFLQQNYAIELVKYFFE